ncbi:MAG: hypothetical protein EOM67_05475 [Spirochaetia bacterium]|nr:hypothetical protein [Spirochaetia bacterium]
MKENPKKKYISKVELAEYLGVNRSQVTRAVKSGRIRETASGRIDWRQAAEDWEGNRSDSLSGTGRANNKKTNSMESVPQVPNTGRVDDMEIMEELDEDSTIINDEEVGKPPKRNTRAYEDYLEKKAKREWAEIKVRKEKGELLERSDVIAVYGATLNGLKTGILSLPQRLTMLNMGVFRKWLASHGVTIDANKFVFLEKEIEQSITSESHFVLNDIKNRIDNKEMEANQIGEKKR